MHAFPHLNIFSSNHRCVQRLPKTHTHKSVITQNWCCSALFPNFNWIAVRKTKSTEDSRPRACACAWAQCAATNQTHRKTVKNHAQNILHIEHTGATNNRLITFHSPILPDIDTIYSFHIIMELGLVQNNLVLYSSANRNGAHIASIDRNAFKNREWARAPAN